MNEQTKKAFVQFVTLKGQTFGLKEDSHPPRFEVGDQIGQFKITMYLGHSALNKRNYRVMNKAQHWYRCACSCGGFENRSQQELIDIRRNQMCKECRVKARRPKNSLQTLMDGMPDNYDVFPLGNAAAIEDKAA